MDFASRRRAAGAVTNAIFARAGPAARASLAGGAAGAGGRSSTRQMAMLAGVLLMVVIPLSIVNTKYPLGVMGRGASTGGGGSSAYVEAVRRRDGRRAARQQKRLALLEDEAGGDEDDDEYEDDDAAAGPGGVPAKKGAAGKGGKGPLRAAAGGKPASGEGGSGGGAPAPAGAAQAPAVPPAPVEAKPPADAAAQPPPPAAAEPPAPAAVEAPKAVEPPPQPAAAAPAAAAPAAAAPVAAAPAATHHPVLFPARYASGDAVPEEGCEAKWGNSYLREFMASRRESCRPVYGGMPQAAAGAFRNYHALLSPDSAVGPKQAVSRVTSWGAHTGANFHWMRNVAVDFNRASVSGDQRRFDPGFITGACAPDNLAFTAAGDQPALGGWQTTPNGEPLSCDEWVHTPTMVVQHDDIGNTYHNLADFWRLWVGMAIAQQPACVPTEELAGDPTHHAAPPWAQFPPELVRQADAAAGAPPDARACPPGTTQVAGVNPDAMQVMTLDGRIMCNTVMPDGSPGREEDCSGPYFAQYDTWFGKGVTRGRNFNGKRVCFSSLAWAASTPDSHIWDKFREDNACTTCPPLRRYAEYVAQRWGQAHVFPRAYRSDECRTGKGAPATAAVPALTAFGAPSPPPLPEGAAGGGACKPYVQVTYVQRKKKPFSSEPVRRRTVSNDAEFIQALRTAAQDIADVEVVVADFTPTPYEQQMRIARSSHVLIGMHGAGLVHGLDQAPSDECGGVSALIEMFPHQNDERGIRNMNTQVGRRYVRWANPDPGAERDDGTVVDLPAIQGVLREVIQGVLAGRKC